MSWDDRLEMRRDTRLPLRSLGPFVIAAVSSFVFVRGASASWEEYWAAIDLYRQGDSAEGDKALAKEGGYAEVQSRLARLRADANCIQCPARLELRDRPLIQAALIHTQRAFAPSPRELPLYPEIGVTLALVEAAAVRPLNSVNLRRFLLGFTFRAYARADEPVAQRALDTGLRLFPDDPDLLLALATLHEARAGFSALGTSGPREISEASRALLTDARRDLTAALKAHPLDDEPHLRLGRVLIVLRDPQGSEELRLVLQRSRNPRFIYLARLFLGGLAEARGRLRAATEEYQRALEAYPGGSVALLALSHAQWQAGNRTAARQTLELAITPPVRAREPDPFWRYGWGHSADGERILEALWKELR